MTTIDMLTQAYKIDCRFHLGIVCGIFAMYFVVKRGEKKSYNTIGAYIGETLNDCQNSKDYGKRVSFLANDFWGGYRILLVDHVLRGVKKETALEIVSKIMDFHRRNLLAFYNQDLDSEVDKIKKRLEQK